MKRVAALVLLSGFIAVLTLGLSGCSSSSKPIGVTLTPSSTQTIDQAQTVAITASVAHDSKSAGVAWTVSGGGTLSGTSTTAATYNAPASVTTAITAIVTATSITDTTKSATLTITVNPPPAITTTSLPEANAGTAYSQTLAESGGTSPYTWTVTPTLPTGLTLSSAGVISGTPTGGGSGSFNFKVTDAVGGSATQALTITVNPPLVALSVTTTSLPGGVIGTAYTPTQLQATGGVPSYTWALNTGSLPAGLSLSSAGVISGTPTGTSGGTYNFTVTVTDSQTPSPNQANSGTLSIAITIATLQVTTTTLPSGTVGTPYDQSLTATGGVPPYTWTLATGSLPASLSLSTAGAITGTPTTAATSNFTVQVADSESTQATAPSGPLSITINAAQACTGTLNNSLLSGNYALLLNGWKNGSATATSAVGSFAADGNGYITSATVDIADQSKSPETDTFTGTYCVGSNSLASINLTNTDGHGGTADFEAALDASDGNGHIISYDSSGTLVSGLLRKQDTSAFLTSAITGNYAFGLVGADQSANRFAVAGEFNSNGSGTISGVNDVDDNGSLNTEQTFTSSDFTVASNGRGTLTTTSNGNTMNMVVYVVSSSELLMMARDEPETPPMIMAGQVLKQSSNLGKTSLDGVSVIEDQYLDSGSTPTAQVGLVTTDGNGNLSVNMDVNDGGTLTTMSASGTYTVDAATGRVVLSGSGIGNHPPVFYLVGTNQAFMVGTDSGVDFGMLTPQTGSSFDLASLSGTYLGGSQQPVTTGVNVEADYAKSDGKGNLAITSYNNDGGTPSTNSLTATYIVDSTTGRVVITCAVTSSACTAGDELGIMYIVSPTQAVVMTSGNDPKLIDFHQ